MTPDQMKTHVRATTTLVASLRKIVRQSHNKSLFRDYVESLRQRFEPANPERRRRPRMPQGG